MQNDNRYLVDENPWKLRTFQLRKFQQIVSENLVLQFISNISRNISGSVNLQPNKEAYLDRCQTFKMERFVKIVNGF